ncbi:glycoside hydrolase family 31 protein [Anditalea andensis]|uniref:Glycoside hydrolase family 31 n=1 Tax=Anditalea andensis TaxID=1048983 RepID=A0A074KZA5_9BACT|nr:glycoside hydrolase family 31 protein [Anditalea andensis]KEO75311.1 glycoside hydrolase family 31 [Anditalea andensis]
MTANIKPQKASRNLNTGAITSWCQTKTGMEGKTLLAKFKISVYAPNAIRIQMTAEDGFRPNPYSVTASPITEAFKITETEKHIILSTDAISAEITKSLFSIRFKDKNGKIINEDDPGFSVSWLGTEVTNYKKIQPNERFIGLGEKTGDLDRSGNAYVNWNTDYFEYGEEDDPLYMSIPFYIGLHDQGVYGIFLDNTHKSVFNFGASNKRFMYFSAEDGDMDYYFIHDEIVENIITAYTFLTGRMELPPIWALGFQQCRYTYYPDTEVLTLADNFRNKTMPADVIYLDIHHMENYKVFTFDSEKFPDPVSLIKKLKSQGFKVVVILDPGLKTEDGYLPYEEARAQKLLLTYPDDSIYEGQVWPGWCAFPDFTHPDARAWWAEKIAFYVNAGVDGFWTDMNEIASWGQFTPNLINFQYEGELVSHRKARNVYGMQMARSTKEGSEIHLPNNRPFVLTRSGFAGVQRYAAAWTGDNMATDEMMLAGIRLVISMGISGLPFSGYDVGGFSGEPTSALFARWMTLGAFTPLFRAHSMINSHDAEPWAFGELVEEISRNYINLRYQMLPLLYSAAYKSAKTGLPIAKSLAIDHPLDNKIYELKFQNQYIFCDQLMVAPVKSTTEICKVYLPEGNWYYFFDDSSYDGKQEIYMESPLNYLPVFVKGGAIIPLQSSVQHTSESHDGILYLHVYKGHETSVMDLYEDEGDGFGYKNGDFCKRLISVDSPEGKIRIHENKGKRESKFKKIKFYFHGFNQETIIYEERNYTLRTESMAYLNKLTEFDPLPDYLHPYFEIKNIKTLLLNYDPMPMDLILT